jgi:hypothetical protein
MLKRSGLKKPLEKLKAALGFCTEAEEVVEEKGSTSPKLSLRPCKRLCAVALSRSGEQLNCLCMQCGTLSQHRQGLECFGASSVAEALECPMSQVVTNAGFNS